MAYQTLEIAGGGRWTLLPETDYLALCERLEELADAAAMRAARARDPDEETFPAAFVKRLLVECENPVRVWREHRGLSVDDLAAKAGVTKAQVHTIESGASVGSVPTLCRMAAALDTTIDHLVPHGTKGPLRGADD